MKLTASALLLIAFSVTAFAKTTPPKRPPPPAATAVGSPTGPGDSVINDSWYTMRAGTLPYGYFHETIENRAGKYSYRYTLTKKERNGTYQENIGALAEPDLTPIAFNLNKSGASATESINASYSPKGDGTGTFKVTVSGARSVSFSRACGKGVILDVFFPLWLKANWAKLKTGYRGWLSTFAEDPDKLDFRPRTVQFQVLGADAAQNCLNIKIAMDTMRGEWCMRSDGVLITLKVGDYLVRRVNSEAEALSFFAPVAPPKQGR